MTVNINFFGGAFFGGGFFGAGSDTGGATPSGIPGRKGQKGKRHERVIRMADIKSREDTAEFLKNQLRIRHPESAFTDTSAQDKAAEEKARRALAKQDQREKAMRLRAEREAAKFAKSSANIEAEQKANIAIENDNMRILLMLASAI